MEFIDLGLPSGLKWAKCNLGATSETEDGDYYQWGSVEPNTNTPCDCEHTPFNNGSSDFDETYFDSVKDTVCYNGILAHEYDAAQVAGVGRMPTKADFDELLANTTNEWIENYQSTGINGRLFTASNGNSIFIPASGHRWGSYFLYQVKYAYVWSSSLYANNHSYAWFLGFDSDNCFGVYANRCNGFPIRPVLG